MSGIGLFVGAEALKPSGGPWEDPSAVLRLAALTATWLGGRHETLLVLGDGPALLAVGTAVLGLQEGRVVEGGERRGSPIRVLSLLEGDNPEVGRALGFRRRPRGEGFRDREAPREGERSREEEIFGDLSVLVDAGILDVAGEGGGVLEPRSGGMAAQILGGQLERERPSGVLAFGDLPGEITDVTRRYARETDLSFRSVAGWNEGAETLKSEPGVPMLDGRPLRFREGQDLGGEGSGELHETADEELMEAARYGTWEAGMTYEVYRWLTDLDRQGGGRDA